MAKQNDTAQVEFIIDCLRNGEQRKAILAKFGKKWQDVTARTFDRRLKVAKSNFEAEQKRIQEKAEVLVAEEVEARKVKIMTVIERQELLTLIAKGEIQIPTKEARWDAEQKKFVMLPVLELPDHAARIRAIAEMNRMDGSYAPDKKDIATQGEKLPTPAAAIIKFEGTDIELLA